MTWGNVPSNRFQIVWAFQPISCFCKAETCSTRLSAAAAILATTSFGTPASASSAGVAITVSSRAASPATSAWTSTFEASSAEICFQALIFPRSTRAIRLPPELSHRHSSRCESPFKSSSR